MLCKQCGAELPDGAVKCNFCGAEYEENAKLAEKKAKEEAEKAALEKAKAEEEAQNANKENLDEVYDENEKKRRLQKEKMVEEKKVQLSEIEKRREEKKKRQRRNKIVIGGIVGAAIVAAAGISTYVIRDRMDKETNRVTVTPAPSMAAVGAITPPPAVTPAPSATPGATPKASDRPQSWTATENSASSSGTSSSNSSASGGSSSNSSASSGSSSSSGGSASGSSSSGGGSVSTAATGGSGKIETGKYSGVSSSQAVSSAYKGTGSYSASDGKSVTGRLVRGGEVMYVNDLGRYVMTFVENGKIYYAYVSEGSTTEQVKDKLITVTASPTGDRYNGNVIYDISSMVYYGSEDYIIPDSGIRKITDSDISGFDKEKLALARNEIYARHGRVFQMKEYSDYFESKSWYKKNDNYNYNDENKNLNEIEIANVEFILAAENKK